MNDKDPFYIYYFGRGSDDAYHGTAMDPAELAALSDEHKQAYQEGAQLGAEMRKAEDEWEKRKKEKA